MPPTKLVQILVWLSVCSPGVLSQDQWDELIQVQVVTRHGARTPLTKTPVNLHEGGSRLTALGERQQYDLGLWLQQKVTSSPRFNTYDPSRVRMLSSAFDRTITSAQSLALGLFPQVERNVDLSGPSLLPENITRANIPIYMKSQLNDVEIRTYANCPAFYTDLEQLYLSDEFKSRELENIELLRKLAQNSLFQPYSETRPNVGTIVPLSQIWNTFDSINVAKTECDPNPSRAECLALPDPDVRNYLTPTEWSTLKSLAHYAEHKKYSREIAGTRLGGNLLLKILSNMGSASSTVDELYAWVVYSAHYPTILSVFSALGTYSANSHFSRETIPEYASALVFELYENSAFKNRSLKMMFKEGLQNSFLTLNFGALCNGLNFCPVETISNNIRASIGYTDMQAWCQLCGNDQADVCLTESTEGNTCDSDVATAVAGSLIGGTLIGIAVTLLTVLLLRCIVFKKEETFEMEKKESSSVVEEIEETKTGDEIGV